MKRVALALMLALAAGLSAAPVQAEMEQGDAKFSVHGEVRTRFEYTENHNDRTDTDGAGNFDDSYDFWPYRVRIGAKGMFARNVTGYIELQNTGVFGDRRTESQFDQDPLGQGDIPGMDDGSNEEEQGYLASTGVGVYQAFIEMNKIGDTAFSMRLGRQEHTIGNQLIVGDLDFYGGASFDGARLWWDWEKIDINAFYYRLTENNNYWQSDCFDDDDDCFDDNTDLYGAYLTFGVGSWGEIEPYVIRFADGTDVDTSSFDDATGNKFYTIGARWTRPVNDQQNSDAILDWSVEYAMQSGENKDDATLTDISADIIEAWIGLNFGSGRNHRVHVGTLMASGQDPASSDFETWNPMAFDTWDHNRLGDADFFDPENIEDINVGYTYSGENHGFRASYHMFTQAEVGVGADDDLGSEIDVAYHYGFNPNLGIDVGVANVLPGDAFGTLDDAVLRVWAQARLRF